MEGIIQFITTRNNAQRQLIIREFFRRYRRVWAYNSFTHQWYFFWYYDSFYRISDEKFANEHVFYTKIIFYSHIWFGHNSEILLSTFSLYHSLHHINYHMAYFLWYNYQSFLGSCWRSTRADTNERRNHTFSSSQCRSLRRCVFILILYCKESPTFRSQLLCVWVKFIYTSFLSHPEILIRKPIRNSKNLRIYPQFYRSGWI